MTCAAAQDGLLSNRTTTSDSFPATAGNDPSYYRHLSMRSRHLAKTTGVWYRRLKQSSHLSERRSSTAANRPSSKVEPIATSCIGNHKSRHCGLPRTKILNPTWTARFAWFNQGNGILALGATPRVQVEWRIAQVLSGQTFLAVRPLKGEPPADVLDAAIDDVISPSMVGLDSAGRHVHVSTRYRCNPIAPTDPDEGWVTLRVQEVRCTAHSSSVATFRFALTNLSQDDPPVAQWCANGINLSITPAPHFQEVVSTLNTRDRFAHTAYLNVAIDDRELAINLAETTCALLSLVMGCRISWLHLEALDASGAVTHAWVTNAVTGPFMPLPLLEEHGRWEVIAAHWDDFNAFYSANRSHSRRIVGLLLNATADDDFLELRGAKLATTVDALRTILVDQTIPTGFRSNSQRRAFRAAVEGHVEAEATAHLADDDESTLGQKGLRTAELVSRVGSLLHPTFRQQIAQMHRSLKIAMDTEQVRRFVASRNELVHEARYICQRQAPPPEWPYKTASAEYFAMLAFVDRLVLRTFGFRGPILDRSARDGTSLAADPPWEVAPT